MFLPSVIALGQQSFANHAMVILTLIIRMIIFVAKAVTSIVRSFARFITLASHFYGGKVSPTKIKWITAPSINSRH